MKPTGERFEWLMGDLVAAVDEFDHLLRRDGALWTRRLPRKWTAGQHAEHVARGLTVTADALESSEALRRAGTLGRRPMRGPLQMMFVIMVVNLGKFPRGARAPKVIVPAAHPDRPEVLASLPREVERHRALGAGLSAADRDRLWIRNPFMKGWHYTFPEVLRMQAVHVRHHARQVWEIGGVGGAPAVERKAVRPGKESILGR